MKLEISLQLNSGETCTKCWSGPRCSCSWQTEGWFIGESYDARPKVQIARSRAAGNLWLKHCDPKPRSSFRKFLVHDLSLRLRSLGLGNEAQYGLPSLSISPSRVFWSIVMGPIFGSAAYWFVHAAKAVCAHAPKDWRLPIWCTVVFPVIGLQAIPFPQLLGNLKGLAQTGFDSDLEIVLAATLLSLRLLVTLAALRAGATGGLLTPGLTIGALLGIVLGSLWNHVWPAVSLGAFALIGSTAFLASSMKMPLIAIAFIVEFTRIGHDFLIPISLAVVGSFCVFYLCTEYSSQTICRSVHESGAANDTAAGSIEVPVRVQ